MTENHNHCYDFNVFLTHHLQLRHKKTKIQQLLHTINRPDALMLPNKSAV